MARIPGRRYVILELPGETVVLDVPLVEPQPKVAYVQFTILEPKGYPVNMIYDGPPSQPSAGGPPPA